MNLVLQYTKADKVVALLGAAFFTLVLVGGWIAGIEQFVRLRAFSSAVMPSTAISFVLIFCVLAAGRRAGHARVLALFAVIGMATVNLACLALGIQGDLGYWSGVGVGQSGLSLATSLGFLVAVFILAAGRARGDTDSKGAVVAAIIGLSTMVAILAGHSFDGQGWQAVPGFTGMSEYTAAGFAIFCIAALIGNDRRHQGGGEFA